MVGEPFNKRSVPCAFGIKIGLYFQKLSEIIDFRELSYSLSIAAQGVRPSGSALAFLAKIHFNT